VPHEVDNTLAGSGRGDERPRTRAIPRSDDQIGGFRVLGEIARGGMGVIYRVRRADSPDGAEYALKLVNEAGLDFEGLARFQREMEALGRASGHPNVVRVSTSGVDALGRPYYVMELVQGRTLHDRIRQQGPLEPLALAELGAALAGAIEHIHAQGIIHRDLKPANILLRAEDGSPVVTDFGLVSMAGTEREHLTRTHDVLGTPLYMPPEQAMGRPVDRRSDVYGLGAILFTAASGEPPVPPGQQVEVLTRVAQGQLTPLARVAPKLPPRLARIILKALATRPEDRFPTAAALAEALDRFREATAGDEDALPGPGTAARGASAGVEPPRAEAGGRSVLLAALAVLILAGLGGLAFLVPRALAIRERSGPGGPPAWAGRALAERAAAIEKALSAGNPEEAIGLADGAAGALVEGGLDREGAQAAVGSSAVAALGARALGARARGRLGRLDPDARGALSDLDRAAALVAASSPEASELASVRAEALFALGRDADARSVLETAARLASSPAARSSLRSELARVLVAALDLDAPEVQAAPGEPCLEARLLAFERALALSALDDAEKALDLLKPAAPPLELALAEVALARASAVPAKTTAAALKGLARSALDRARTELALAWIEPRDAPYHLESALAGTTDRGGLARGVRCEARLAQAALARRTGDAKGAAAAIEAGLAEAPSARWRVRFLVERGRLAFARDDLDLLRAVVASVHSSDVPGVAPLRALDARAVTRRGLARWTARLLGAGDGLPSGKAPFAPEEGWDRLRRSARSALGVAQAARVEAIARGHRDLGALLDFEGAVSRAEATDAWKSSGLRGYLEDAIAHDPAPEAVESARSRAAPWLERAVDDGRLAVDLLPDDAPSVRDLLEALLLSAPDPVPQPLADEVKGLAARLGRLLPDEQGTLLVRARAAIDVLGDAPAAAALVAQAVAAGGARAETYRVLARIDAKGGDQAKLVDDVTHLMLGGPFELAVARPYAAKLTEGDRSEVPLRTFAHGGAIGADTIGTLWIEEIERAAVRKFVLDDGLESSSRDMVERAMMAAGVLADQSWREPELRPQLLWARGLAGLKLAADTTARVHALRDLAEALHDLNDRSLVFLAQVEAAARDGAAASAIEEELGRQQDEWRQGLWFGWEDGRLLAAALAAVRMKRDHGVPGSEATEKALDACGDVLDACPGSATARVARSFILARAGRADEAADDLAAALAIQPDLEATRDPQLRPWIEKSLDLAKKRGPGEGR
jgi:serine/threonine-protein kinase